eukprot:scaffold200266_cov39-Tisochrysis_lutea.AAC.1
MKVLEGKKLYGILTAHAAMDPLLSRSKRSTPPLPWPFPLAIRRLLGLSENTWTSRSLTMGVRRAEGTNYNGQWVNEERS